MNSIAGVLSLGVKAKRFVRVGVHEYVKFDKRQIKPDQKVGQPKDGKPVTGLKRCILETLRTHGHPMNVEEIFKEIKRNRCVWIINVHQIVYIH